MVTSAGNKSCTRFINAAKVPPQMYPADTLERNMNLYICDTPGFADNRGIEIDISNNIGMMDALAEVRSARIVVLMAKSSV